MTYYEAVVNLIKQNGYKGVADFCRQNCVPAYHFSNFKTKDIMPPALFAPIAKALKTSPGQLNELQSEVRRQNAIENMRAKKAELTRSEEKSLGELEAIEAAAEGRAEAEAEKACKIPAENAEKACMAEIKEAQEAEAVAEAAEITEAPKEVEEMAKRPNKFKVQEAQKEPSESSKAAARVEAYNKAYAGFKAALDLEVLERSRDYIKTMKIDALKIILMENAEKYSVQQDDEACASFFFAAEYLRELRAKEGENA